MSLYVALRSGKESICHIFILPLCFFTSFHKPDAWNTVNNAVVMPMMPAHAEQLRVVQAGRFPLKVFAVVYVDGIGGISAYDGSVFYIDGGDPVLCSGHNEGIVETDLIRSGRYPSIPVYLSGAKAQMPLAYYSGVITSLLQHFGQRLLLCIDQQRCGAGQDLCVAVAPGINPCKQRIAAGSACCGRRITIGKA